jgi:hypothetical protein
VGDPRPAAGALAAPLVAQLVRMAARMDPPAYITVDGGGGRAGTRPAPLVAPATDRFPPSRLGFTLAMWVCVAAPTAQDEVALATVVDTAGRPILAMLLRTAGNAPTTRTCVCALSTSGA